ncbi:hypothetical protein BTA51_05680 [Hahella sp. CCB-MM4]|uniref:hypothetical protein n=1 Tax=Hahella sp. (strain CCB-MM4) TaxID=1926491 RepID=UPI000B9C4DD5|nr:hypothetical protein [Hahella sp. CCB-MM4]OZG74493.1 hypothetical protein BTA51_05680 [Hahella sp. CCB-MM4]
MGFLSNLQYVIRLTKSQGIARRYLITNGFDGAFTMLGLNMGFYVSNHTDLNVVFHACLGAAIALAVSGLSSAYISESAERLKSLHELEQAMITDLSDTVHAEAARIIPIWVAFVNGASPLMVVTVIASPIWLALLGSNPFPNPVAGAILVAFVVLFALGVYAGKIGRTSWIKTGFRTLLVGLLISLLVLLVG